MPGDAVRAAEAVKGQSVAGPASIADVRNFDPHPERSVRLAFQVAVVVQYSATAFESFAQTGSAIN